jgi:hypothetical protein
LTLLDCVALKDGASAFASQLYQFIVLRQIGEPKLRQPALL